MINKSVFIIPFIVLFMLLNLNSCKSDLKETTTLAIQEIINSIDEYESELSELGYEIASEKLEDKNVLSITTKDTKYIFDVGLSEMLYNIDEESSVQIEKTRLRRDELIDLDSDKYCLRVTLYAPEFQDVEYGYDPFNEYTPNFKKYLIKYDDEQLDDMKIKDYISEAELIDIVKDGLELESLLVGMYEKNIAEK